MLERKRSFTEIWNRIKREWKTHDKIKAGDKHLHGHIHSHSKQLSGINIDVGVDAWDYKPVSFKTLRPFLDRK